MSYPEHMVTQYSVWHHVKTSSLYVVLGVATQSTNGPGEHKARAVIYYSLSHGHLCYRDTVEFLDGRFCPITAGMNGNLWTQAVTMTRDIGLIIRRKAEHGDTVCPKNMQGQPCILIEGHPGECVIEPTPEEVKAETARQRLIECVDKMIGTVKPCNRPPDGWYCTRPYEHEGPCAAHPMPGTFSLPNIDGET